MIHLIRSLTEFQKNLIGITVVLISFSGYGAGVRWSLIPGILVILYLYCHTIFHNLFVAKK